MMSSNHSFENSVWNRCVRDFRDFIFFFFWRITSSLFPEFPWHCALLNSRNKFYGCSATLLSCDPVVVVTAAHCAPKIDIPLLPIVIRLSQPSVVACGKNYIRDDDGEETVEEEEQRLTVKKVITHPHFNDRKHDRHSNAISEILKYAIVV